MYRFDFADKHVVKPGETLYSIARRYEWPIRTLVLLNPQLTNINLLYPGQIINIPFQAPFTNILVKPGDTLYSIVRNYNAQLAADDFLERITLTEVLAFNPSITNPNVIYAGMYIYVPEIM